MTWTDLPVARKPWEYTAYSSVFKLSHDIAPAGGALGAGGCADCHASSSVFWTRPVMKGPFDEKGTPSFEPNARLLGVSPLAVRMSGFRHEVLEPVLFCGTLVLLAALLFLAVLGVGAAESEGTNWVFSDIGHRLMLGILGTILLGPAIIVIFGQLLPTHAIGVLPSFHKGIGLVLAGVTIWLVVSSRTNERVVSWLGILGIAFMLVTGAILLNIDALSTRQVVFTLHDIGAVLLSALAAAVLLRALLRGGRRRAQGD